MTQYSQNIHWSPGVTLDDVEKQVVLAAFQFFQKNKTATARALNIAIRTLETKLEKYAQDDTAEHERKINELARRKDFLKRQRGETAGIAASGINPDGFATFRQAHGITTEGNTVKRDDPAAGVRVEPAAAAPAQSPVSVSERQKVQSVSSQPAPKGDPRRSR